MCELNCWATLFTATTWSLRIRHGRPTSRPRSPSSGTDPSLLTIPTTFTSSFTDAEKWQTIAVSALSWLINIYADGVRQPTSTSKTQKKRVNILYFLLSNILFVCLFVFFKPKNRCEVREQCDRSGIGGSVSVATGAPWLDRDQICRNPEVSFIFKIQSQLKM